MHLVHAAIIGAGNAVAWQAVPLSEGRQLAGMLGTALAAIAVANLARTP